MTEELEKQSMYELFKRACTEDHETAEEPSSEVQYEEEKKTQHMSCLVDDNVMCDKAREDGILLSDVCEKCEHHKADGFEAALKKRAGQRRRTYD